MIKLFREVDHGGGGGGYDPKPMTKEQIVRDIVVIDESKFLLPNAKMPVSHNGISYAMIREELVYEAMEEYKNQETAPLLARIKELETIIHESNNR